MKNRIFKCGIAFCLLAAAGVSGARAQESAKAKPEEAKEAVVVEKTGTVIGKRYTFENVEYVAFSLKAEKEIFDLHAKTYEELWKFLGAHEGKTVTVTGELKPAKPPKHPDPSIKITSVKLPGAKPDKPLPPGTHPGKKGR